MKGILLLSDGRTGTSWLSDLAQNTRLLGDSREWFAARDRGLAYSDHATGESFVDKLVQDASTPNGVFMTKIFPPHMLRFHRKYRADPIQILAQKHDLICILLERRDTLGQAISFARAYQSRAWASDLKKQMEPEYDFDMIARFYGRARESTVFWQNYLGLSDLEHVHFVYEDLLPDGQAFLDSVAKHAGIDPISGVASKRVVQRDVFTDEWRKRFLSDVKARGVLSSMRAQKTFGERYRTWARRRKAGRA